LQHIDAAGNGITILQHVSLLVYQLQETCQQLAAVEVIGGPCYSLHVMSPIRQKAGFSARKRVSEGCVFAFEG